MAQVTEVEMTVTGGTPSMEVLGGKVKILGWRIECSSQNGESVEFVLYDAVPPRIGQVVKVTVEFQ